MVEQELVRQMRVLAEAGWGTKRISREVGVARNTVRRYLRSRGEAQKQRPQVETILEKRGVAIAASAIGSPFAPKQG